jgi:hypothetical protein
VGKIMKLTRRQLRKLIIEAIEAGPHGVWRVPRKDRSPRVSTGKLTKDRFHGTAPKKDLLDLEDENLQSLLQHDDESFKEMGYDISDSSSGVMPGSTKAAFEDEEYAREKQRVYTQGVGVAIRDSDQKWQCSRAIVSVIVPHELIDLVVDAWKDWRQNPATKEAQYREAINTYYNYVDMRLPPTVHSPDWYEEDTGHPELEKALKDAGEVL